jgi:PBP1b-binding outer membrane lipoprotein LpoB
MVLRNIKNTLKTLICLSLSLSIIGCSGARNINNAAGMSAIEVDHTVKGPVSGVGIESQDIVSMTDKMLRDILATPVISSRQKASRIIIDDSDFTNEGSQPINKKLIINRLRVDLNRSANGKIKFIGRTYASSVEKERNLKREGVTDTGTTGLKKAQAGADFKLVGSIATLDSYSGSSGLHQRYNQVTFELLDLESSEIVWSNNYEFEKAAADDAVYR